MCQERPSERISKSRYKVNVVDQLEERENPEGVDRRGPTVEEKITK